jgi:hypothetical protein
VVDLSLSSTVEVVKHRRHSQSVTINGPEADQIRAIYALWMTFKRTCVRDLLLDPDWVELVFEDFVLRGGQHAGGRAGTMPERIAWGVEGYRMGRADAYGPRAKHYAPIVWQIPNRKFMHKLRDADAWIKGREHERSAFNHMMIRVSYLKEHYQPHRRL